MRSLAAQSLGERFAAMNDAHPISKLTWKEFLVPWLPSRVGVTSC